VRNHAVRELLQLDRSGDQVRLTIEEFRKDAPLAPKDLELSVPPDAEVVRPLGKGAKEGGGPDRR
jgi:hypothetical protein